MDTTVTFDAFRVPDGTGPADIRIVISKKQYILAAEDESCYYLQPRLALMDHAEAAPVELVKDNK